MRHKIAIRNRIASIMLVVLVVAGMFSGIIPGTQIDAKAATSYKVLLWEPDLSDAAFDGYVDYAGIIKYGYENYVDIPVQVIMKSGDTELTASDLEGVQLVYILMMSLFPPSGFAIDSNNNITLLSEFLNTGGRIVMNGENASYPRANKIVTDLANGLGGHFTIDTVTQPGGTCLYNSNVPELVDNLDNIYTIDLAAISNSNPQAKWVIKDENNNVFVMDEEVGNGNITFLTDTNIYDSCIGPYESVDYFLKNLLVASDKKIADLNVPVIVTQPNNADWIYGDTTARDLAITASAPNGGTLSYQWYKGYSSSFKPADSNLISGATSSTFTIPSPESMAVGSYYYKCVVTNTKGVRSDSVTSSTAVVKVYETSSPSISAQPDDLSWYVGDATARSLSIAATSPNNGTLSYQWYKGDAVGFIPDGSNILSGETSATYQIPNPDSIAEGTYYYKCIVTNSKDGNSASITSSAATVQVLDAEEPVIIGTSPDLSWNYSDIGDHFIYVFATSPDNGNITFQWYKSDLPDFALDENTIATREKSPYFFVDSPTLMCGVYYYRCKVTNTKGNRTKTVISRVFTVTVNGAGLPEITAQPQNLEWEYGDATARTLSVTASSPDGGELSYQWYEASEASFTPGSGSKITGATSASYDIRNPQNLRVGKHYYKCVVTNTKDGNKTPVTSKAATVTVYAPKVPLIRTQPQDLSWYVGNSSAQTLTISATSQNNGVIGYQWYEDNTASFTPNPNNMIIGATSASYAIPNPQNLAVGKYYYKCVVSNTKDGITATVTSDVATVTVRDLVRPPVISAQPQDLSWYYGDTSVKTLSIGATSQDGGTLTYQWYRGYSANFTPTSNDIITGANSPTYTIPGSSTLPVGNYYYRCTVTNTKDNAHATAMSTVATVKVLEVKAPVISSQTMGLTWYYGDSSAQTLTIYATSQDGGTLSFQWYTDSAANFTPDSSNMISGATSSSYAIPSPGTLAVGNYYYKCVVTNTKSGATVTVTSNAATVTVLEVKPPVINTQPQDLSWYVGDTTARTLTISATSPDGGTLSYQWYKGSSANFTPGSGSIITGATSASYAIPSPETMSVGKYYYKCVVTNSNGTRNASLTSNIATVTVKEIFAPIINRSPQNLTWYYGDTSVQTMTIRATSPDNNTLTYQWYMDSFSYFIADANTLIAGATSPSYIIPGSSTLPVGKYYYRCIVSSSYGNVRAETLSPVGTVTVLEAKPPVINTQPQDLTWYYGDTTARTLTISATSQDGGTLSYQWYKDSSANFTPDSSNIISGATSDSYAIPSPETIAVGKYYYKCVVTNTNSGATIIVTSNAATVTVLEVKPPVINTQPQDLSWYMGDTTARSLTISATSPDGGTLSYQWYTDSSANFTPGNNNKITGATSASYAIPSPEAISVGKYYYKCVVTNSDGTRSVSLTSNESTVTVLEVKPPVISVQPNDLTWYYGDATVQTLTITATSPDNGTLTYQWYKGSSADFTPNGSNLVSGATGSSYAIPSPQTVPVGKYYYKCVVANKKSGWKATVISNAATVTVLEPETQMEPAKVVTIPSPKHLIYNGSAQELITPGTASGGTMKYALGTASNAPQSGWSTSIPKGTSIGTYYIWYMVVGEDGREDSAQGRVVSTIAQDLNQGDIATDVETHENTPETSVQGLTEDIGWVVTTPEEQADINNNGTKGRLWLEITNIDSTVNADDKQLIESRAQTLNDGKVGMYLDFSMYFQVGNKSKRQMADLNGVGISVEVAIPAYLRSSGTQRTFYLVSVHNGAIKIHGSTTGDKIKATLTEFSTYAIIYADGEEEEVFKVSVKIKQTDEKIVVDWDKIDGVGKVEVYVAYCGTKYSKKPAMTTTTRKVTIKKINGKKLNQKRNYKMYLVAYDKKGNRIGKTLSLHFGGKNCKYTNPKKLKLSTNNVTLSVGQSTKVIGKITYENKKKKPLSIKHAARFRYVSDNPAIATVDKSGNITGVTPGVTYVYVMCQNGLSKKVKVTVN